MGPFVMDLFVAGVLLWLGPLVMWPSVIESFFDGTFCDGSFIDGSLCRCSIIYT
jgi:hypothetical protein